ncbi:MAG: low-specificity L-threonine aldolase [Pseudomonadota bacterium]
MIDLRSDTVTEPTAAMRKAMAEAPVGDDVYGDDPSVNALQAEAAERLGKEAALFVSSGTQSNLLAILTHCGRGDEYIAGQTAHCYQYEGGGAAVLGGVQPQPLSLNLRGEFESAQVRSAVKPDDPHFARTRLLCLENTYAGAPLSSGYLEAMTALGRDLGLFLHLDGARLFNAAAATGTTPCALAAPFDSVSVCLSKGLGAPVGSLLLGPAPLIEAARRLRKMLGGGMRQAGVLAAAGRYALAHHVERLVEDHAHATQVAQVFEELSPGSARAQTNMVHLSLPAALLESLATGLAGEGIRVRGARWVFHLDVDAAAVSRLCAALRSHLPPLLASQPPTVLQAP